MRSLAGTAMWEALAVRKKDYAAAERKEDWAEAVGNADSTAPDRTPEEASSNSV